MWNLSMRLQTIQLLKVSLFLGFFLWAPWGMAQETHDIRGQVTDRQGRAVVGANIFIKGTVIGANSLEDGSFSFTTLLSGDTVLQVRHIGMYDLEIPLRVGPDMGPLQIRLHEKPTEVAEVVVTADPTFSLLDGNRATLLSTMDVETTPGGDGDVIGALRTLPGVQQIGQDAALFVRGGSREESKTMIDGLEITHPYMAGIPDQAQNSRFSPHLFEGIAFNTGGYSALYGDALSSVLSLHTRDHPTANSSVVALMLYGAKVGHNYVSSARRTSFGVDLGYSAFGPYYKLIGHQTDWINAPVSRTINANFRQNIGQKGMLKWYGYGNRSDQRASVPARYGPGEMQDIGVKNSYALSLLSYTHRFSPEWMLYAGYGMNTNRDEDEVRWTDTWRESDRWTTDQHQLRMNVHGKASERLILNLGSEAFLNRYGQFSHSRDKRRWDAWAEARLQLAAGLHAQFGMRTAWNEAIPDEFLWMPRLNLSYGWTRHSITAGAGAYAQQPDRQLLYRHNDLIVTPQFAHARVENYLLNYQWKDFGRILRLEAYYKDYDHLFRTSSVWQANGTGYARGLDIFWRDPAAAEGLDYWISYSWLDTERQHLEYPQRVQPTFATPHTLHAVAKQFIEPLGLFVGGSYSFSTGRPYDNPNSSEFLADRTPVYHQINLNVAFLRKWGNTFNTFVLAVNNVTGRHQIYDYRFSADGSRRWTIDQPYKRGFLIGWFISIGQDRSSEILNQLP